MFHTIQDKILYIALFGSCDTLVTDAKIIATSLKLNYARAFVEDQCIKLGEEIASSVSNGKRKIGK